MAAKKKEMKNVYGIRRMKEETESKKAMKGWSEGLGVYAKNEDAKPETPAGMSKATRIRR